MWRLGEPIKFKEPYNYELPVSYYKVQKVFDKLSTYVGVPLITKGDLVGLLILGQKKDRDYMQEDLELLESLANHTAIAIQNFKLQEQVHENKKLESLYRFSSFVVHDLRNTVSMFSLLTENVKTQMDDPEFRQSLVKNLTQTANKMKNLLSKISMTSDKVQLEAKKFNLNKLIKQVIAEIKSDSKIKVKMNLSELPTIISDPDQIKKVITNLILNAIEAMPEGGDLTVETKLMYANESTYSISQDHVLLSISDTGCGMTADFINMKLFKPFQSTKPNGLGLGLYHCHEIIKQLNGSIWVKSKINKGTTFFISLPVNFTIKEKEEILNHKTMQIN